MTDNLPPADAALPARAVKKSLARPPEPARFGVVLVNYKRWSDTIECLESVFRSTIPLRVIVVDNGSGDNSLDRIAEWADGLREATPLKADMARFSQPALPKPIPYRRIQADALGAAGGPSDALLTLVDSGGNLGFAAGNNIGLRLFLTDPRIQFFWLLNNDTVIEATAAAALVTRMSATHKIGMCGTVVRFYHTPDMIQVLGGSSFSLLTGQGKGIGARQPAAKAFDPAKVTADIDFVLGASLATSREFLEIVGPMDESFFLYFEEIEWAKRSEGRFSIGFAHGATVYHKEGGSIGSSGIPGKRSEASEYWLARSRLTFIRRYAPILLPWHWLFTLIVAARRVLRGQLRKAGVILRALFGMQY